MTHSTDRVPAGIAEYKKGIVLAAERGLITAGNNVNDEFGAENVYNHINPVAGEGTLDCCNTRGLPPLAKRIIADYRGRDAIRVFELGSGFGVAAAQARTIAEGFGMDITIETIALNPVNPFYRPVTDGGTLVDDMRASYDKHRESLPARKRDSKMPREIIPLSEVLAFAHHTGFPLKHCERPFIDHQYIGWFPELSPEGPYDFIFENYGPIHHAESNGDDPERVLHAAASLLAPGGILLSSECYFDAAPNGVPTHLPEGCHITSFINDRLIVERE